MGIGETAELASADFFLGGGGRLAGEATPRVEIPICAPAHSNEFRGCQHMRGRNANSKFRDLIANFEWVKLSLVRFSSLFARGKRKCVNFGHVLEGGIERGDGRQVSKSPPGIYFGYLCITQGTPKSVRALIFRPSSLIFARVVAKEKCLLVYPFTRFAEGIFDPPLWGN